MLCFFLRRLQVSTQTQRPLRRNSKYQATRVPLSYKHSYYSRWSMLAVAAKVFLSQVTGLGRSKLLPDSHPGPIIPLFRAVMTVMWL